MTLQPTPTPALGVGATAPVASTPVPVNVLDLPSPGPLAWATFGIAAASFVAASIAAWEALVTLRLLARKSRLRAHFPEIKQVAPAGHATGLEVKCNILNEGNRGLRDFRVTFAFSPQCNVSAAELNSAFVSSLGHEVIDRRSWDTVELQHVGPIYAPDDLWVATIRVGLAQGESFQVRWHLDTEDGRMPAKGWSSPQTFSVRPAVSGASIA